MAVSHIVIYYLDSDARPTAFLAFAAVYLAWPFSCLVAPKALLAPILLFPFFGIWLGIFWTGDMGNDYMFAALPPCFAGVWSVLVGGIIALFRIKNVI